jgi:hypothetical protein
MLTKRSLSSLIVAATLIASFAMPAAANFRCGFDRYGYHPPSWSGCDRLYGGWGGYPPPSVAYAPPPPGAITPPLYGIDYGPPGRCHFDNGWYGVIVVCK